MVPSALELRIDFEEARVNELLLSHLQRVEALAHDEGISVGQLLTELAGGDAPVLHNLVRYCRKQ